MRSRYLVLLGCAVFAASTVFSCGDDNGGGGSDAGSDSGTGKDGSSDGATGSDSGNGKDSGGDAGDGGTSGDSGDSGSGGDSGGGDGGGDGGDAASGDCLPDNTTFQITALATTAYVFNGNMNNPNLILCRGRKVTFQIQNLTIHPFFIKTAANAGQQNDLYNDGVTGQGQTNGDLVFTVPQNAPNELFYQCGNHSPMHGTLTIKNPPN